MKSCSMCGYWRIDADFYPDRRPGRSKDGLHHACKDCVREDARERSRNMTLEQRDRCNAMRREQRKLQHASQEETA